MRSSRAAGRIARLFGLLALLAVPAALLASRYVNGVTLLRALYVGVPVAFACALVGVAAARRARFARARSVRPEGGRWEGFLAWAGLYVAVTSALALAVYGALRAAQ